MHRVAHDDRGVVTPARISSPHRPPDRSSGVPTAEFQRRRQNETCRPNHVHLFNSGELKLMPASINVVSSSTCSPERSEQTRSGYVRRSSYGATMEKGVQPQPFPTRLSIPAMVHNGERRMQEEEDHSCDSLPALLQ